MSLSSSVQEFKINGLREHPREMRRCGANEIEPGLYLGDVMTALNKEGLESLGVKHILRIADDLGPPLYTDSFDYTIIEIADSVFEDISYHFDHCFNVIDSARSNGGGVLVHCQAGMSRSATIVIAYLMKTRGMSFQDALALVKARRPIVRPNEKFVKQLKDFEMQLALKERSADSP